MFRKQIDYVLPYYHRNSSNAISTYQPSLQHSPTPPQFYTLEKKNNNIIKNNINIYYYYYTCYRLDAGYLQVHT